MEIYTRKGDEGKTGLIGGTRVGKDEIRIHAYGTVDELNSWIGMIRDHEAAKAFEEILLEIQNSLFTIGSHLASDASKSRMTLPEITDDIVLRLERAIDEMEEQLEPMRNFVLPGGHLAVSSAHVARCVCRRAERLVVEMAHEFEVEILVLKYLNRLSDYLFVLSRLLTKVTNAREIPWIPK